MTFRHIRFASALILSASVVMPSSMAETVVLQAKRMLDVETGEILTDPALVIQDDRIKAVNPREFPTDAVVIRLGEVTLLPGLMDLHTHFDLNYEQGWENRYVKQTSVDLALRAVPNARRTLLAGFTTVRDAGAGMNPTSVSLMKAIEAGWIDGPRIVPAAHSIGITGGHCDVTGYAPGIIELGPEEGVADGIDEVQKAVRFQAKYGARVIKICATAGIMSSAGKNPGAQQYSREEMRAIVLEAERHELRVMAHAHGTAGIIVAAQAGVASVEHASILNEEAIQALIDNDTYIVPTVYQWNIPALPSDPPEVIAKLEMVKGLVEGSISEAITAGVKIAFGTDAGVLPHGDNAKEFAELVRFGMTPLEAIRTSTLYAADLLGVDDRGVLAPGMLADIIAVPGNPLEDIHALEDVRFVMRGGIVFKTEGTAASP